MTQLSKADLAVCKSMALDVDAYAKASREIEDSKAKAVLRRRNTPIRNVEEEVCQRLGLSLEEYRKVKV